LRIGTFWVPGYDKNLICIAMNHDFISVILGNVVLPEGPLYDSKDAARNSVSATVYPNPPFIFLRSQMHTDTYTHTHTHTHIYIYIYITRSDVTL
jgi:hypothetical protein